MKVFSQLVSAQIENRTADYSSGTRGRVWMRTDTSPVVVKFDDGSAIRTFVTTDNSQTLTNKTLTSPIVTGLTGTISQGTDIDLGTAANTSRITFPSGTLAAITALARKEGTVWYATDTDKLYKDDGTSLTEIGSGSGGDINYIGNPDAESGTTGWATYADAAGTSPVDGTGGAPTVTLTRTTTTPLRGTGSFLITKDAANRQGEGVSYAFTINNADKAKVLNVSFDYEIPSGTFASGDSSDLRVWVYDVTNTVLIPVSPYTIQGGGSSQHKFTGTFQTSSSSTSYRLIIHVATTSASAWTFEFDNVVVGPQTQLFGAPIGDWNTNLTFTPASAAFGTISEGSYVTRRVGDCLEVKGSFVVDVAAGGDAKIALPTGYTIDTAKLNTTKRSIVGYFAAADDSTNTSLPATDRLGVTFIDNSDTSNFYICAHGSSSNLRVMAGSSLVNSVDTVMFTALLPITGWSSTVLMSNDTDTRVVAARFGGDAASATSGNIIIFPTTTFDTHSAYNASTGRYTVPVSGYYQIGGFVVTASANINLIAYVDAVAGPYLGKSVSSENFALSGMVRVNAGQVIDIRPDGTFDAQTASNVTITRVTGPSAIAATESVNALAESNTARSISDASANTGEFLMEDEIFDSHGAYSTSTAIFTVPTSGKYRVSASVGLASSANWGSDEVVELQLFKNGSYNRLMGSTIGESTASRRTSANGTTIVSCVAGDTLEVRVFQDSDAAINTDAVAARNWVSYERIGN
jgi:hypothetical protein